MLGGTKRVMRLHKSHRFRWICASTTEDMPASLSFDSLDMAGGRPRNFEGMPIFVLKKKCVSSKFRTPDAPEMRQCQTKSFLGDLVRFKTCINNHDLRNCLKKYLRRYEISSIYTFESIIDYLVYFRKYIVYDIPYFEGTFESTKVLFTNRC